MNATHGRPLPTTIPQYLEQLREALRGADPAMVQDALYDAEEYLRSELAEQAGRDEAEVIASVAGSYGAPEEVADIYRETEVTVNRALRPPRPPKRRSLLGRFFGVAADPYTYGALFYMLLSLATGVFYFTWVVTGVSTSVGLLILIIGVPLLLLFLLSVRLLSLVEGRIVEVLLGVRMPRRPPYTQRDKPWLTRIGELFTDGRTWTAMAYLLVMLPLGTAYFSATVTLLAVSLSLLVAPVAMAFGWTGPGIYLEGLHVALAESWLGALLAFAAGLLLLFVTLHLARLVGHFHGWLAKHLLVRNPLV
ncbi:putative transmembrane protein [Pseudoxanthomonas suwonensis 11-1]|uniref:Putative transmembrane protein n=1 Tax=Pseudoxanthomonas suwonensis (strain 11-1) TaxID=743721 RepID=E6WUN2_PSEUU|nr:sensor domain-containing protein [Pseudoxanthomonas suwonensis]ADV27734.1 putative transmembrane protein [Pseudoxanthomonas suwonensis 11-1]